MKKTIIAVVKITGRIGVAIQAVAYVAAMCVFLARPSSYWLILFLVPPSTVVLTFFASSQLGITSLVGFLVMVFSWLLYLPLGIREEKVRESEVSIEETMTMFNLQTRFQEAQQARINADQELQARIKAARELKAQIKADQEP